MSQPVQQHGKAGFGHGVLQLLHLGKHRPQQSHSVRLRGLQRNELISVHIGRLAAGNIELHILAHGVADGGAARFLRGLQERIKRIAQQPAAKELERIAKELDSQRKFLAGLEAKLSNEKFVSRAPEAVVAAEREKAQKTKDLIASLEQSEAAMKKL